MLGPQQIGGNTQLFPLLTSVNMLHVAVTGDQAGNTWLLCISVKVENQGA